MSALDTQVGGSHYKDQPIQPVQYIEANKLGFLEGCVLKRITRHELPTGKGRQDIEKAIHELQLLLELRYPERPAPPEFLCRVCDCYPCECVEHVTKRPPPVMTKCGDCLHVPCICGGDSIWHRPHVNGIP